jgi:hypothetical protein
VAEVLKFAARAEDLNAESKSTGRKRLAIWLRSVDAKIEARELISFDARLARALTKFPSSTLEGHCWVGQARLSRSLVCSRRTAERSLARLKRNGLLLIRQRGAGRTARYIFCVDAKPLFPGLGRLAALCNPGGNAASDPSPLAKQAPTDVASLIPSTSPKMAKESSKELQVDSFQTTTSLRQKTAARSATGEAKRTSDEGRPSIQTIQNRIVSKLAGGDIAQGWIVFGDLPIPIRAELEARERGGEVTDAAIAELLAKAVAS